MKFLLICILPVLSLAVNLKRRRLMTCSGNVANPGNVQATTNCESMTEGTVTSYPSGFTYDNKVAIYTCPTSGKRIVVSNSIPDHDVSLGNPNQACEQNVWIEMPLNPTKTNTQTEPVDLGVMGVATNGVLIYGAQEGGTTNAVEPAANARITDAQYWWGHASPNKDWHYHSPQLGKSSMPSSDTLLGYALDGFPIYGAVEDTSLLDECNMDSSNRYHVRTLAQVDGEGSYCNGISPAIKWNYVLGCYWGSLANSSVLNSSTQTLPSDCVLDTANSNNAEDICTANTSAKCGENASSSVDLVIVGAAVGGVLALLLAMFCLRRLCCKPSSKEEK